MADIEHVHRIAKRRRASEFAVRRWLVLGAASAGVGAALFAASLAGPQIGSAHADDSAQTSSAAGSAEDASSTDQGDVDKPSATVEHDAVAEQDEPAPRTSARESLDDDDTDADADADEPTEPEGHADADEAADADIGTDTDAVVSRSNDTEDDAAVDAGARESSAMPAAAPATYRDWVASGINTWTRDSQGWIDSLPVADPFKEAFTGTLWTVRRTFFNQAPTVAPVQISGRVDGPVTGTINAVDPDGDALFYVLSRGPATGSVKVNADGSWAFTPGTGFTGVDTFTVSAIDPGFHMNLLDLFRPWGGSADALVNQRAIKFNFNYTTGAEYWTEEARVALQQGVDLLVAYFIVTQPVTLDYNITGQNSSSSDVLASAFSDLISHDPGFHPTVVGNKIQTGDDANGAAADGVINWNFADKWAFGDDVAANQYDFKSVLMHELLHSFGFIGGIGPVEVGGSSDRSWTIYDSFVVTAQGNRVVGSDLNITPAYESNVSGANGGVFFSGASAVAAYGKLVPLYAPAPYSPGSSIYHLDDKTFVGADIKVMNAFSAEGARVRKLSAIELGILRDIGYTVIESV